MTDIDAIDKKILYELDLNCCCSFREIGDKIGLSKSTVRYRFNKLIKNNFIKGFYTLVDFNKLGYIIPRIHFTFQYTTQRIEKEIIDYFVKNQYTSLVASTKGLFDLSVFYVLKNMHIFYDIWEEMQQKYAGYFSDQKLSFFIRDVHYPHSYLLENDYDKSDRLKNVIRTDVKRVVIDHIDMKILETISLNARMPLTKIGNTLKINIHTIEYRINNLIKLGVIKTFKSRINFEKFGYRYIKSYIYLSNNKIKNDIIDYIEPNPNLTCIDYTTGSANLELEFHVKNMDQFYQINRDLSEKFYPNIRKYELMYLDKANKVQYLKA